jgi:hypothetical protein
VRSSGLSTGSADNFTLTDVPLSAGPLEQQFDWPRDKSTGRSGQPCSRKRHPMIAARDSA